MSKKVADVPVNLNFVQINCVNIEEARKRAAIIAFLTYDLKNRSFVKMFTQSMLEDPFFYSNVRKAW